MMKLESKIVRELGDALGLNLEAYSERVGAILAASVIAPPPIPTVARVIKAIGGAEKWKVRDEGELIYLVGRILSAIEITADLCQAEHPDDFLYCIKAANHTGDHVSIERIHWATPVELRTKEEM